MVNLALAHKEPNSYLALVKNMSFATIFQGEWQESPKWTVLSAFSNFSRTRLYLIFILSGGKDRQLCFKALRFINSISSTLFSLLMLPLSWKQKSTVLQATIHVKSFKLEQTQK